MLCIDILHSPIYWPNTGENFLSSQSRPFLFWVKGGGLYVIPEERMEDKMTPMLPPGMNFGVASSLSWAKSIRKSPKTGITRIRGLPKTTASFQRRTP